MVNSYVVSEKSGDALAEGILILAANETLRRQLGSVGAMTAATYYDTHRLGWHGASMFRYHDC